MLRHNYFFFFQAEDGIRDTSVTGVQTCALPISITDSGPALVTVEYDVEPEHQARFLQAVHKYERIRRRDGAYQWGIFRNLESPNRYVEMFLVDSWAEHMRQHERSIHADREVEERVQSLARGTPRVHHLVRPTPKL